MTATDNPLLTPWTAPFEMPPFAEIRPEHYRPAFDAALTEHNAEIAAIVADPAPPGFDNVIGAMERAGQLLNRVGSVFFNLVATDSDDALQEIERVGPCLSCLRLRKPACRDQRKRQQPHRLYSAERPETVRT